MSKIVTAAALIAGAFLAAPRAEAQQAAQSGSATTTAPAKTQATGACRVKDQAGGRSCTGDVPEAACAAIAREAKGPYTWTADECP